MQYAGFLVSAVIIVGLMNGASRPTGGDDRAAVDAVLTDFHDAASDADFDRYFGHFAPDCIFLGTDPAERWTVQEFQAFARPHFDAGTGWTYVMQERHVTVNEAADTAWFDEVIVNEKYGACRGTGVLVKHGGDWKLAQYNLTLPVPNDLAMELVERIRATGKVD